MRWNWAILMIKFERYLFLEAIEQAVGPIDELCHAVDWLLNLIYAEKLCKSSRDSEKIEIFTLQRSICWFSRLIHDFQCELALRSRYVAKSLINSVFSLQNRLFHEFSARKTHWKIDKFSQFSAGVGSECAGDKRNFAEKFCRFWNVLVFKLNNDEK